MSKESSVNWTRWGPKIEVALDINSQDSPAPHERKSKRDKQSSKSSSPELSQLAVNQIGLNLEKIEEYQSSEEITARKSLSADRTP